MACAVESGCFLCSLKITRDVFVRCLSCRKPRNKEWQYAAINSYVPTIGVPSIPHYNSFLSVPHNNVACISDISPLSTFISVFTRLQRVGNVIHFGKPRCASFFDIINVTKLLLQNQDCSVIAAVDFVDNKPVTFYTSTSTTANFYNTAVHALVSEMVQDETTVCWHWNHDSAMTALQFQSGLRGLWISYNGCAYSKSTRLLGSQSTVMGIPLHSDPLSGDTVAFNVGMPCLDVKSTLAGPYADIVKCSASEYLNCVMKDNRCFSCSVVCQIHENMKANSRREPAQELQVTLTKDFARCLQP